MVVVPPDVSVFVGFGEDVGVGVVLDGLAGLAGSGRAPEDLDDGLDVGRPGLCQGVSESGDSTVVLDELDAVLLGDLLDVDSFLDFVDDCREVGPALWAGKCASRILSDVE